MLVIFTDTDTDITPEIASSYNIKMISMPYIVGNKQYYPYKDSNKFDSKAFYNMLRDGTVPTTCAINIKEYQDYFEPIFKEGNDILYIHFSSAMTATFGYMDEAVEELLKIYPERKFYQIDTKAITIGAYLAVREILDVYKETNDINKVMEFANKEIDHFATFFFTDDLKYFKKSGRVSGISATMGDLIGIKPIIHIDTDGVMKSISKEKGRKHAIERIIKYVEELQDNISDYRVVIGHTDYEELAHEFGERLNSIYGNKLHIEYVMVNPTAGSHCGPNGVGVSFHAIHR